jgi:hypothetical protein
MEYVGLQIMATNTCRICKRENRRIWRNSVCRQCANSLPTAKLVDDTLPDEMRNEIANRIELYAQRAALRQNLFK